MQQNRSTKIINIPHAILNQLRLLESTKGEIDRRKRSASIIATGDRKIDRSSGNVNIERKCRIELIASDIIMSQHDVVIVGGGTAGVAAAIAAGRNGADTIPIERYGFLGGTITAVRWWVDH